MAMNMITSYGRSVDRIKAVTFSLELVNAGRVWIDVAGVRVDVLLTVAVDAEVCEFV